uniref:(northern house mosquito) hypothetical protein n=1 Tax=Culex pipiens TaxID=7175 RepID=A0A8D8CTI6_CULPI
MKRRKRPKRKRRKKRKRKKRKRPNRWTRVVRFPAPRSAERPGASCGPATGASSSTTHRHGPPSGNDQMISVSVPTLTKPSPFRPSSCSEMSPPRSYPPKWPSPPPPPLPSPPQRKARKQPRLRWTSSRSSPSRNPAPTRSKKCPAKSSKPTSKRPSKRPHRLRRAATIRKRRPSPWKPKHVPRVNAPSFRWTCA